MALTNIPIDITEVAEELVSGDSVFSVYDLQELKAVAPFDGMKPGPENFPGSMILRRCTKGRVLCRQGEAGATAFQILTREDAVKVLRAMLRGLSAEELAFDAALQETSADVQFNVEQLQRRRDALRATTADDDKRLNVKSKPIAQVCTEITIGFRSRSTTLVSSAGICSARDAASRPQ